MLALVVGLALSFLIIMPVSLKWELNKRVIIPYVILLGVISVIPVLYYKPGGNITLAEIIAVETLFITSTSVILLLWRFFRDPPRRAIREKNNIYSPADGRIIYVKRISKGEIPVADKKKSSYKLSDFLGANLLEGPAWHIGIAMTYLDVHVNRSPIDGSVLFFKHIKGAFRSLKYAESIFENERAVMIINGEKLKIGLVLIASRLVRMIVPFVKQDDYVYAGSKIGKIRFGSQVDLIIPDSGNVHINVVRDDFVKAGLSVIGRIKYGESENANAAEDIFVGHEEEFV